METVGDHWGPEAKVAAREMVEKVDGVMDIAGRCGGDMAMPLYSMLLGRTALLAAALGWDEEFFTKAASIEYETAKMMIDDPDLGKKVIGDLGLSDVRERLLAQRSSNQAQG